jgi:large subunit ribosomal protein L28
MLRASALALRERNNRHFSTTNVGVPGPYVILFVYLIREIALMARCEICSKGPIYGNRISHAHNLTSRRWNPNLQRVRVLVGKTHKTMRVCTGCIRSGRITKA